MIHGVICIWVLLNFGVHVTASNLLLVLVVPIHRVKAVDDLRAAGSSGCSA